MTMMIMMMKMMIMTTDHDQCLEHSIEKPNAPLSNNFAPEPKQNYRLLIDPFKTRLGVCFFNFSYSGESMQSSIVWICLWTCAPAANEEQNTTI